MIFELIFLILILGVATAATTETMQKGSIFDKYRAKAETRSNFFDRMFLCEFCSSHWIALLYTFLGWNIVTGLPFWAFIPITMAVRWISTQIANRFHSFYTSNQ
jgi:hypothetical protein